MESSFINDEEKQMVEFLQKIDQADLVKDLNKYTKEERLAFVD